MDFRFRSVEFKYWVYHFQLYEIGESLELLVSFLFMYIRYITFRIIVRMNENVYI